MEHYLHEPTESWAGALVGDADGGPDPKWRGCHFYIDTPYLQVCHKSGVKEVDLFALFSNHGERAVDDDKWMREWLTMHPSGGAQICYAVVLPNVIRFDQFLSVVIPAPGRVFPPTERIVWPRVKVVPEGYDDPKEPILTDIAKNGQGRFKFIAGDLVEPDDPRWLDLQLKWPHMGKRD